MSVGKAKQLALPPISAREDALEVLRVWAVPGEEQEFSVQPTWEDTGAWGLLFVDLARYLAYVYEQEGRNGHEVLARIRELFDAEWDAPTDQPQDASAQ
jgi:hypothetical protein